MAGNNHGAEAQEVAETTQDDGRQQAAQEQPQVSGKDWEKARRAR